MRAVQRSAFVAGLYLLFNLLAMPLWWRGVSVSGGFRGGIQLTILIGFVYILLFDLISAGWILTRVCWMRLEKKEEGCHQGWLVVLKPENWDDVKPTLIAGADVAAAYEAKMAADGFDGCA